MEGLWVAIQSWDLSRLVDSIAFARAAGEEGKRREGREGEEEGEGAERSEAEGSRGEERGWG